jgi:hypothetical protein
MAEAATESARVHNEETVNQQNEPIDEELTKCIVGLVCLVLFGIVYIVSRL